ncbi:hypothetical protein HHI36_022704 [Cryptolaemus montrouzieri]|uniref:Uncharacterized protein n=1 Tax=Cryptolaemus montrouzieri TaxID=559131 RepID=A0ABD2N0Y9_9CUCU
MDEGISGFRTAGIWPFEPTKFSEDDFGPNEPSAYVKVATMDKAISGLRTARLWPFEPTKFSEDDFGPNEPSDSTAIEIPINLNETEVNIETPVDLIPGSSETNQGLDVPIETLVPVPILKTNQTNKPCAKQHSEIFTSTPLKSVLEKK